MKKILHIDSSCSLSPSISRQASQMLVDKLAQEDEIQVTYKDIGTHPIPHINQELIEAFYSPTELSDDAKAASLRSEQLINEFLDHDIIVMGVPMYNYTIPSTLKSYFDHLARPGVTFRFTPEGQKEGLIKGKRCLIAITRAGELSDSLDNHQETYLKTLFEFLGIEDYEFIVLEGLTTKEKKEKSIARLPDELDAIVA